MRCGNNQRFEGRERGGLVTVGLGFDRTDGVEGCEGGAVNWDSVGPHCVLDVKCMCFFILGKHRELGLPWNFGYSIP